MAKGCRFEDFAGIWVRSADERCFLTVWDEEAVDVEKLVLEIPGQEERGLEQPELQENAGPEELQDDREDGADKAEDENQPQPARLPEEEPERRPERRRPTGRRIRPEMAAARRQRKKNPEENLSWDMNWAKTRKKRRKQGGMWYRSCLERDSGLACPK